MEEEKIKEIFVYNINEKDKIVGILKAILKGETLKNIRNKIKKMNDMHVFIKYINNEKINIIDKEIEEDFTIENILINDKETYKIFFQEQYIYQNKNEQINNNLNYNYNFNNNNNNFNNNRNFNNLQNMSNMNYNMMNNLVSMNNFNNLNNNLLNNMNNNMNNFNNLSNNFMNNINNFDNMNNFNNINNNFMNNMNNFNNNINICNMNYMNMMNNLNNFNNFYNNINNCNNNINNNINLMNNINNKNNNMNDFYNNHNNRIKNEYNNNICFNNINENNLDFQYKKIILYNITFKLNHSYNVNLSVIYFVSFHWVNVKFMMYAFGFELDKWNFYIIHHKLNHSYIDMKFLYNTMDITSSFEPIEEIFKNDSNPIVMVDGESIRPYKVSFKTSFTKKEEIIINYCFYLQDLINIYLKKISISCSEIEFFYNKNKLEDFSIYIGDFFKDDYDPTILVKVKGIYNLDKLYNIIFVTNNGDKIHLNFNKESSIYSIKEIKEKFLWKMWHSELLDSEDEIIFTYNQKKLEFDGETTMKSFFGNNFDIEIDVNDVNNILSTVPFRKYNVLFKTSNGLDENIEIDCEDTIESLLKYYLYYIKHPELINTKDKIKLLYKGQQINFGDKKIARKYFKNEKNPKIIVTDPNNYLLNNSLDEDNNQKVNVIFYSNVNLDCPSLNKYNILRFHDSDEWRYFQIRYGGKELDLQKSNKFIINLTINYGTTVDKLLKKFLCKIHQPELIDSNKICFIYNASRLKFGDQTFVEKKFNFSQAKVEVSNDFQVRNDTGSQIEEIDRFVFDSDYFA